MYYYQYILQRLDLDSDGVVSLEEFLTTCQQVDYPFLLAQTLAKTPNLTKKHDWPKVQFLPKTQFSVQDPIISQSVQVLF